MNTLKRILELLADGVEQASRLPPEIGLVQICKARALIASMPEEEHAAGLGPQRQAPPQPSAMAGGGTVSVQAGAGAVGSGALNDAESPAPAVYVCAGCGDVIEEGEELAFRLTIPPKYWHLACQEVPAFSNAAAGGCDAGLPNPVPSAAAPTWTDAQREAAVDVWEAPVGLDNKRAVEDAVCAAIARVAPLFVDPRPAVTEAMRACIAELDSVYRNEGACIALHEERSLAEAKAELAALDSATHVLVEAGELAVLRARADSWETAHANNEKLRKDAEIVRAWRAAGGKRDAFSLIERDRDAALARAAKAEAALAAMGGGSGVDVYAMMEDIGDALGQMAGETLMAATTRAIRERDEARAEVERLKLSLASTRENRDNITLRSLRAEDEVARLKGELETSERAHSLTSGVARMTNAKLQEFQSRDGDVEACARDIIASFGYQPHHEEQVRSILRRHFPAAPRVVKLPAGIASRPAPDPYAFNGGGISATDDFDRASYDAGYANGNAGGHNACLVAVRSALDAAGVKYEVQS